MLGLKKKTVLFQVLRCFLRNFPTPSSVGKSRHRQCQVINIINVVATALARHVSLQVTCTLCNCCNPSLFRAGVEIAGAVITGLGLIKNAFEVLQSIQDKRVEMALEPDTVRELKGHIVVVKTRLQPFEGRRLHKDSDQQTIINLRKFLDVTEARLQKYRGPSFFRLLKRVVIGSRWPVFLTKSLAAVAHCEAMMKDVQVQMDISGRVRLPAVQVQSPAFAVAKAALLATSSDLQRPRGLPQVLLLNGMHGMGKSTLALQLALDLEGSGKSRICSAHCKQHNTSVVSDLLLLCIGVPGGPNPFHMVSIYHSKAVTNDLQRLCCQHCADSMHCNCLCCNAEPLSQPIGTTMMQHVLCVCYGWRK